ncbi:hypothetical protein [Actinomadura miaoliensis]|uniref:Uncharacterized protein n=1 Tax=Actinomadura miaoliensis TaxID=430685 RepID=A0ABP7V309_9ACTN
MGAGLTVAAVTGLGVYFATVGLEEADKLGSVVGGLAAVAGLSLTVYGLMAGSGGGGRRVRQTARAFGGTTRLRHAALAAAGRRIIEVDTFTEQEARSYLTAKLADRAANTAQADALARELGYLPLALALAQAATYILNADLDCAAYRRLLGTRLLHRVLPDQQDLPDDHGGSSRPPGSCPSPRPTGPNRPDWPGRCCPWPASWTPPASPKPC